MARQTFAVRQRPPYDGSMMRVAVVTPLLVLCCGLLVAAGRPGTKAKPDKAAPAAGSKANKGGGKAGKASSPAERKEGGKSGGPTAAAAATPAPVTGTLKLAVLDLGILGLSSDERRSLELLLRNSIATIEGVTVIPAIDIQMALSDPKNVTAAQCGGGPECAALTGRLVGADRVVFGTISTIGDAFSLSLRVVDVKSGKELAREQSRTSGNRNVLIPELRLAAYRLVAPDKIRGWIEIECTVDGVDIEVNGQRLATTPVATPIAVVPGDQVLVAKRPGFSEFQKEFAVAPFERVRVKLELGKTE